MEVKEAGISREGKQNCVQMRLEIIVGFRGHLRIRETEFPH